MFRKSAPKVASIAMPYVLQKGLYQDLCLSVQPGSSKNYLLARLFMYVAYLEDEYYSLPIMQPKSA